METYSNYDAPQAENTDTQIQENGFNSAPAQAEWAPPEEFKGTAIDRFKSEKALCEAYLNLNSLLSKRREDFTQQDKQAFLQMREEAYGIPATADGYQIDTSKIESPDGEYFDNQLNDSEMNFIKNLSTSLGLSNDQAQLGYDLINNYVGEMGKAVENYALNNGEILGEMWGGEKNVDKCLADVATGISVAATALGCDEAELKQELAHSMGDLCCPHIVELFRNLAQLGGRGYGHGVSAGTTPVDARNEIEMIKATQEYKDSLYSNSKEAKELRARIDYLHKVANGEI